MSVRLGLFGGITMSTDAVNYDHGQDFIAASFKRPLGPPLEIKGNLSGPGEKTIQLVGANIGRMTAVVHSMNLDDTSTVRFDYSPKFMVRFPEMRDDGGRDDVNARASGLLSLSRVAGEIPAPENCDLPLMPNIAASIRLVGSAQVPQNSTLVMYDPLKGTIEISFRTSSKLKLENVFLQETAEGGRSEVLTLKGEMVYRAAAIEGVEFKTAAEKEVRDFEGQASLPPKFFKGIFQGNTSYLKYRFIAQLDYAGKEILNAGELFFSTFPLMRLKFSLCLGRAVFAMGEYQITSFDHLALHATLGSIWTNNAHLINLGFSPDWNTLSGVFVGEGVESGDINSSGASFLLTAQGQMPSCDRP